MDASKVFRSSAVPTAALRLTCCAPGAAVLFSAVIACTSPTERYPAAEDCKGRACGGGAVIGAGGANGSVSDAGQGEMDAGAAGGDAGTYAVDSLVVRASSVDISTVLASDETVAVSWLTAPEIQLSTSGSKRLTFPRNPLPDWVRVQADVDAQSKIGSTLRWVGAGESPLQLITIDEVLLQDVGDALLLTPTTLDAASGHVLLNLRDQDGKPVPGVHVAVVGGVVAYDIGATFSDATDETGDRGAALWLNAPTAGSGTREVQFRLEARGVELNQRVPVEPRGLTIAALLWTGS
jgi:hypothetical protein